MDIHVNNDVGNSGDESSFQSDNLLWMFNAFHQTLIQLGKNHVHPRYGDGAYVSPILVICPSSVEHIRPLLS